MAEKLAELEASTARHLVVVKIHCLYQFVQVQESHAWYDGHNTKLGLNDEVVEGLAKLTDNERFAYDSYRRFIQMFSDVVMEIAKAKFEKIIDEVKEEKGVKFDTELTAEDLKE